MRGSRSTEEKEAGLPPHEKGPLCREIDSNRSEMLGPDSGRDSGRDSGSHWLAARVLALNAKTPRDEVIGEG